jgi:hypothetical protein
MTEETFEERALADDLTAYVNDKHTQEECIGFIDGYKAALAKLKNLRLGVVVGQSEQLCPYCGNTGRRLPQTLDSPDGQECECGA